MALPDDRETTLGIFGFLALGATSGAALLAAFIFMGADMLRVGTGLHDAVTTGSAYRTILLAFFVIAPLSALLIVVLMGMRSTARTETIGRTAATTVLYGIPILWLNMGVALVLSAALLDRANARSDVFMDVLDLLIGSILPVALLTGVTVGMAALIGPIIRDAFPPASLTGTLPGEAAMATTAGIGGHGGGAEVSRNRGVEAKSNLGGSEASGTGNGHSHATGQAAGPASGPASGPVPAHAAGFSATASTGKGAGNPVAMLSSSVHEAPAPGSVPRIDGFQVSCPDCTSRFQVSGDRPLRIMCPGCGKSGTVR